MTDFTQSRLLAARVAELGGNAYFVGGCVRDRLMGRPIHDLDIEVHGIPAPELEGILDELGGCHQQGKSFGIYRLRNSGLDIALPRTERATGSGHRDFTVQADPFLGTKAAARRRDFTINAMMEHILTGEILDFFGGRQDLQQGILRHIDDDAFPEDPLRVLRAAQFGARFGFRVAPETIALCRQIDLSPLSRERILGEVDKAHLQAPKPAQFWELLREMGQLSHWFPELEALIGVPQNQHHHQEGDVWNHTMLVLDQAAKVRKQVSDPRYFLLAALCHDFGKAVCTQLVDGVYRAHGHETEGLPLVERFLQRLTDERNLRRYVVSLTALHMKPGQLAAAKARLKATNRMFDQAVAPADLIHLSICDGLGKLPSVADYADFLWGRYAQFQAIMARPYVTGQDLIAAGLTPGESFSAILAYAHKLRLAGVEKQAALKSCLGMWRKR